MLLGCSQPGRDRRWPLKTWTSSRTPGRSRSDCSEKRLITSQPSRTSWLSRVRFIDLSLYCFVPDPHLVLLNQRPIILSWQTWFAKIYSHGGSWHHLSFELSFPLFQSTYSNYLFDLKNLKSSFMIRITNDLCFISSLLYKSHSALMCNDSGGMTPVCSRPSILSA